LAFLSTRVSIYSIGVSKAYMGVLSKVIIAYTSRLSTSRDIIVLLGYFGLLG